MLTTYATTALYRKSPRLWFSSRRLETLGFAPGDGFLVQPGNGSIRLTRSLLADNHVSYKRCQNGRRPVIDLNCSDIGLILSAGEEARITAVRDLITISPSVRTFHIRRALAPKQTLRVVEMFAGGGTLSQAFDGKRAFDLHAAIEIEPNYADVYSKAHPSTHLIQADVRRIHPSEIPAMDILACGIPCTNFSNLGVTHHKLKGKSELGDTGDLFISVCSVVAHHMPLACVFENVPQFANSLAGQALVSHLEKLGYFCSAVITKPNEAWGEPSDRRRWVMVATLRPDFQITVPNVPFAGTMADYLDIPDPERDAADVKKSANRVALLERHVAKHKARGNGFKMASIGYDSTKCPTVTRTYHFLNRGPLVQTPFGLRMLRQSEIERLHGAKAATDHYRTAVEVLGQGVLTRVLGRVVDDLAGFLGVAGDQ